MQVLKRIRMKLKDKRGISQYLEFMIAFVMLMAVIATGMEVAGVMSLKIPQRRQRDT